MLTQARISNIVIETFERHLGDLPFETWCQRATPPDMWNFVVSFRKGVPWHKQSCAVTLSFTDRDSEASEEVIKQRAAAAVEELFKLGDKEE